MFDISVTLKIESAQKTHIYMYKAKYLCVCLCACVGYFELQIVLNTIRIGYRIEGQKQTSWSQQ